MQHTLTRQNTIFYYFVWMIINFKFRILVINAPTRLFITSPSSMISSYHFSSLWVKVTMKRIEILIIASKNIKKSTLIFFILFFRIPWINWNYCFHSNWFINFPRFMKIKPNAWNIGKFSVLRHLPFLFVLNIIFEFW